MVVLCCAFMQAGFCTENDYVKLALEPEAASLYCIKELEKSQKEKSQTNETREESQTKQTSGQHLVVDCGGGTVDIAAHKWVRASPDATLEVDEVHKIYGGSCGSFAVNAEFEKLLLDIFSTGTDISLSDIKERCGAAWSKLLYEDFENSKCSFTDKEITVNIPKSICTYIKEKSKKTIAELIIDYKEKWDFTYSSVVPKRVQSYLKKSGKTIQEIYKKLDWDQEEDAIVVPPGVMTILFIPVVDQIIQIIEDVLKTDAGRLINNIFLVGGFSVSNLLFKEVEQHFLSKVTVRSIPSPDLAVLFGSIEFGKKHDVIRSRVMHLTLGIETWDDFQPDKHDERRKYVDDNGKPYCRHVFTKFVEVGQSVSTERSNSRKQVFTAIPNEDNICRINIYGSYEKDPMYIDDHCSFLMGEIKIDNLPITSSGVACEVTVHMDVRGTEIVVTAVNNATSKEIPLTLNWIKDF